MPAKKKEVKEERKESQGKNNEALGISGFTLGIVSLSLIFFTTLGGALAAVAGLILGLMQQSKHRTKTARIGIILNIIGLVLNIVLIVLIIVFYPQINTLSSGLK